MVMPYAAGGPGDTITRLFAAAMHKSLGQTVVVDNTAGASGSIGTNKVARAKPNGYTVLMIHVSRATNLAMFKNLPYHPVKAYASAGKARLPSLPAVPAIAEAGVQGFDINISFGLYAPKGTPAPVLEKLTAALQKAVADPEVRSRLDGMGVEAVSVERATPAALRAHLKNEIDTLGGLLVKAGVQPN